MKKYLLSYLLGGLSMLILNVGASYLYSANDIGFNPTNSSWNVDNVQSAINDLKDTYTLYDVKNTYVNISQGDLLTSRSASVILTKGKYVVTATMTYGHGASSLINESNLGIVDQTTVICDNCTIKELNGIYGGVTASKVGVGSIYYYTTIRTNTYLVDVKVDGTVVSGNETWYKLHDFVPEIVTVQATKIGD